MNQKRNDKSVIEIIEESIHLLRLSPGSLLFTYYLGSIPFVIALLFFCGDMSRSAYAVNYCASSSFILAILFIWMKCWQSVFVHQIQSRLSLTSPYKWTIQSGLRLIAVQTIIQPSGFFILPIALLLTLPFAWVFAFYQNISAVKYEAPLEIKQAVHQAVQQAKLWPRQNHILICLYSIFSLVVFVNICSAFIFVPNIIQTVFGIGSMFTMSRLSILNTTFFATTCAVTYLCMDPLVKTSYALRAFYGSSLTSGDDLKVELKKIVRYKHAAMILIIPVSLSFSIQNLSANECSPFPNDVSTRQTISVSPEQLDQSIENVLTRPEFSWRMPREKRSKDGKEFFVITAIKNLLKKIAKSIKKLWKKIIEFLAKLLPKPEQNAYKTPPDFMTSVHVLLFIVLCLLTCILALYIRKLWQRRKKIKTATAEIETFPMPDINDEQINAGDLPADKWITLAKELVAKGALRQAIRAIYLATLAHLAEQNMIAIAKYKSNRDYEAELKRRVHEKKDLFSLFSAAVIVFDKAWYGMHDVSMTDIDLFKSNHDRIISFAK